MQLADEHISMLQELYKKHYGVELTKKQTLERGLRLVCLLQATLRANQKGSLKSTDNNQNLYGHDHS